MAPIDTEARVRSSSDCILCASGVPRHCDLPTCVQVMWCLIDTGLDVTNPEFDKGGLL